VFHVFTWGVIRTKAVRKGECLVGRRVYLYQFKGREFMTAASTGEGRLDTGESNAVGDVDDAREFLEVGEELGADCGTDREGDERDEEEEEEEVVEEE